MNGTLARSCGIALGLLVAACGAPTSSPRAEPPPTVTRSPAAESEAPSPEATATLPSVGPAPQLSVIFDDDGSPDGTTALLYLLSHPRVSLEAVNISYGEAHPRVYIQHVGRVLASLGREDIPLGAGQDAPLAGTDEFPEGLRESANDFWGLPLPNAGQVYPTQDAAELIVSAVLQAPTPVTIFVSGPNTNLAQALRLDPRIGENIAAVYIMGGAVLVPGNIGDLLPDPANVVAEWNFYADAVAAQEVFDSGVEIYLVPLDATNQVTIGREDTGQWRLGGETARLAAAFYDMLLNNWGTEEAAIWDVMTAAIMVNPGLCEFQDLSMNVVTVAGNASGQSLVTSSGGASIHVCLNPDADSIRRELAEIFSSSR